MGEEIWKPDEGDLAGVKEKRAGVTALALRSVATPMVAIAEVLASQFTGLDELNNPAVRRSEILAPLSGPFVSGQLELLEDILRKGMMAMDPLNDIVSVLTGNDPQRVLEVIKALRTGSVLPASGDDQNVRRQKMKEARRLGIDNEDLFRLARIPQVDSFLRQTAWWTRRWWEAEWVVDKACDSLDRLGGEAREYAEMVRSANDAYRKHSNSAILAAQRRFTQASEALSSVDLTRLSGSALDRGMRQTENWVDELSRSIDTVGLHAVSSMREALAATRAARRAGIQARQIETNVMLARKMMEIAGLADNGALLSATAAPEIIQAQISQVLAGVTGAIEESVGVLQPVVARLKEAVTSPLYLKPGGEVIDGETGLVIKGD